MTQPYVRKTPHPLSEREKFIQYLRSLMKARKPSSVKQGRKS